MDKLNILSLGAGAIGTYIGGSLALAGHNVVFLEQPAVVDTLRAQGLTLDLGLDPRRKPSLFRLNPPAVTFTSSLAEALSHTRFDVMLFALKSFDTEAALRSLTSTVSPTDLPPALCLQNGVDNEPAIAAALGPQNVIYGTVTSAVGRKGPGQVVLEKLRGTGIAAGHPLSERLVRALDEAYLNARLFPNAADMKWSKLLTNLLANPTSAILDMSPAQIFAHPALYRLEIEQLRECLAVMRAQGIRIVDLPGTPVRALAFATRLPLWLSKPFLARAAGAGRGGKMPSFHIDLHAGRKQSEVTYLHGAVVRAGKRLGIPTPVNQLLTETLLALTEGRIPLTEFAHQPEKLLAQLPGSAR
ncbi:MAG: ketopantoate reductase family protein [Anaerolineales bacterium]|nr:ketopantoate reductase family protein [Anaerolineales bacterium]MDW8277092.1 ketopantoate reductase family protein [Anaerolineales bacterium]